MAGPIVGQLFLAIGATRDLNALVLLNNDSKQGLILLFMGSIIIFNILKIIMLERGCLLKAKPQILVCAATNIELGHRIN